MKWHGVACYHCACGQAVSPIVCLAVCCNHRLLTEAVLLYAKCGVVLHCYESEMVITEVSFKQNSTQPKKWDKATIAASKTFIRTKSVPGMSRRTARSDHRWHSTDEGHVSKVN